MEHGPKRVMRWFTADWHNGELGDKEFEAAPESYAAHLAEWRRSAPAEVRALADLNLHDAQAQSWSADPGSFEWRLLIGDLQRGYEFADISYQGAELIGMDPQELDHLGLTDGDLELVSDELDAAPEDAWEHRFYFWPGHEFGVRFQSATVRLAPAPASARR